MSSLDDYTTEELISCLSKRDDFKEDTEMYAASLSDHDLWTLFSKRYEVAVYVAKKMDQEASFKERDMHQLPEWDAKGDPFMVKSMLRHVSIYIENNLQSIRYIEADLSEDEEDPEKE
jgi:hypothetical protein